MGRIVVALAGIALATFFMVEAGGYPATAARLPNLLGGVVICLALAAIVQAAWPMLRSARTSGLAAALPNAPRWRDIALGAAFLAWILLYARSITVIGYLIVTPVFLAAPLALLRPLSWPMAVLTVGIVTSVIFGIFVWFLNLSLPLWPAL